MQGGAKILCLEGVEEWYLELQPVGAFRGLVGVASVDLVMVELVFFGFGVFFGFVTMLSSSGDTCSR